MKSPLLRLTAHLLSLFALTPLYSMDSAPPTKTPIQTGQNASMTEEMLLSEPQAGSTNSLNFKENSTQVAHYEQILPEEILSHIISYITNLRDLKNFALVCKQFNTHAHPILNQDINKWSNAHSSAKYPLTIVGISKLIKVNETTLAANNYSDIPLLIFNKTIIETKGLKGHWNTVVTLMLLNPNILVSGSKDTRIKLWNTYPNDEKPCLLTINDHSSEVRALEKIDETTFASADIRGMIFIFSINTNTQPITYTKLQSIQMNTKFDSFIFFNPSILGIKLKSGRMNIYKFENNPPINDIHLNELGNQKKHKYQKNSLLYSTNETLTLESPTIKINTDTIATKTSDNQIALIKFDNTYQNAILFATLPGHANTITSLELITPNVLASSCLNGSVKLWNIKQSFQGNRCIAILQEHNHMIYALSKLNDDEFASLDINGNLHKWTWKATKAKEQQSTVYTSTKTTNTSGNEKSYSEDDTSSGKIHKNSSNSGPCIIS